MKWFRARRRKKIAADPAIIQAQRRLNEARELEVEVARVVTDTEQVLRRNNLGPSLAMALMEEPRWSRK